MMKTKLTLFLLCFCSLLFTGCFEKQSFYGTYTNKSELNPEKWRVVELIKPNYFRTYEVHIRYSKAREMFDNHGNFIEYDDYLFLETDTVNNTGYKVYFTDKSFDSISYGGSKWRETLYRVQ